jgi:hypothetical protein
VEITRAGHQRLAGWLGLNAAAASRYHGLVGQGRAQAGRRERLLKTLAHTLGTSAVFVALAVAAEAVRRAGGSDHLAEWRSAAAWRHDCKPDGYGCYVRDGGAHGFFLEYDRGTESGRRYAAKFRAYYRYRDSGRAERDYDGFPACCSSQPTPRRSSESPTRRTARVRSRDRAAPTAHHHHGSNQTACGGHSWPDLADAGAGRITIRSRT